MDTEKIKSILGLLFVSLLGTPVVMFAGLIVVTLIGAVDQGISDMQSAGRGWLIPIYSFFISLIYLAFERSILNSLGGMIEERKQKLPNRKEKQNVPEFDIWLFEKSIQHPNESLEDMLQKYIKQYNISIKHELDEPEYITYARTKLKVLEGSTLSDPDNATEEFVSATKANHNLIALYDSASSERKRRFSKREQSGQRSE